MEPRALTVKSDSGLLREIRSTVRVAPPTLDLTKPPEHFTRELVGIWDTGATGSAVTQVVIDELQIQPVTMTTVHGVHGPRDSFVYRVDLLLPSGVGIPGLHVTLAELIPGADVLIGMDVITQGDFAITNRGGETKMTFRVPSMIDLDWVVAPGQSQGTNRAQRRAKVPGSRPVVAERPRKKN